MTGRITRVQIPPYTDRWAMGDRFGELVKVTVSKTSKDRWGDPMQVAHVKLDISGKTMRFILNDCTEID